MKKATLLLLVAAACGGPLAPTPLPPPKASPTPWVSPTPFPSPSMALTVTSVSSVRSVGSIDVNGSFAGAASEGCLGSGVCMWFQYGFGNFGTETAKQQFGFPNNTFQKTISVALDTTGFQWRAVGNCQFSGGGCPGSVLAQGSNVTGIKTFAGGPTAETPVITLITETSATATCQYGATVVESTFSVQLQYRQSGVGSWINFGTVMTSGTSISRPLTGLLASTSYEVRLSGTRTTANDTTWTSPTATFTTLTPGTISPATGTAVGTSTVSGVGASTAAAVGSASGTSTASAVSSSGGATISGVASAAGVATASGVGASTAAATAAAAGTSTVTGFGEVVVSPVISLRRVVWVPDVGGTHTVLEKVDQWTLDAGRPGWESLSGTPDSYIERPRTGVLYQLVPAAGEDGTLEIVSVDLAATLGAADVALPIPAMFTPYIKYGVLADMLKREGEASDPVRAAYCEERFQEGIELAKLMMGVGS